MKAARVLQSDALIQLIAQNRPALGPKPVGVRFYLARAFAAARLPVPVSAPRQPKAAPQNQ